MSVIESKLSENKTYKPNKDFTAKANVKKDDLNNLISSYVKNPQGYWEKLARDCIAWNKDFTKVLSGTAPNYKWFEDGELNVSFNCLDRHANQEKDAIGTNTVLLSTSTKDSQHLLSPHLCEMRRSPEKVESMPQHEYFHSLSLCIESNRREVTFAFVLVTRHGRKM